MKALDLFSGIGGMSLALKGIVETVAYVEIDDYARRVLKSRMLSGDLDCAPIFRDIKKLTKDDLKDEIDIFIAGFPCQDISCAGRGKGLEGSRSGLFYEIIRLAKDIKPSFIFLENVDAIRSRGLPEVLQELSFSGYDNRWCLLSAKEIGAPHKRQRWFCLSHLSNPDSLASIKANTSAESEQIIRQSRLGFTRQTGADGVIITYTDRNCSSERAENISASSERQERSHDSPTHGENLPFFDWHENQPPFPGMDDGLPHGVDRNKCLGNAVVPMQARIAFDYLLNL